ncbi:MAG TPA: SDR family oxidoreductase [Clostridia bacterium]|nr:SDR family oxidoreductase [Clostridia bacterium]
MALYLVTGVAGFIGSSIARALLDRGERVRGIDNFSTGFRENLTRLNGLDFREGDITDGAVIAAACKDVEYVFHEAAIPSVPRSVLDPIESNNANVNGTIELLVAARDAGVKRVTYAGSSSAYGDTPALPKREDMLPEAISPYAVSKLAGELYMKSFTRVYGLETVTLRYFNVFGPHQDPTSMYSGVIAKFAMLMLRGEQPTIFGDGEQSRDFTYIDNVVEANLTACHAPAAQVSGRVFNVATGQRITLNEMFAVMRELTGYNGNAKYEEERNGDIKHSLADVSLAAKQFGYSAKTNLREGLLHTIEWYRQQALAANAQ